MTVVGGVERDLAALPAELRSSGLAEGALAVAAVMDLGVASAAELASCLRALESALDRLRELAPPSEEKDGIDRLADRVAEKRAAQKPGRKRSRRSTPKTSSRS